MAEDSRNGSTVLPEPGKRNVLVTSALPYVNNIPHLGNIVGSVLSGDVFARYCRGRGINTLYVGGTDEYGTTTEARALAEGCTPKELCDKYRVIHADVYKWFNISFDIFGRTTTELQTQITQDIFLRLNGNGFLKERQTTQLYSTQIGTRESWTKLHHLSTTEYLTYEGGKFSKSRNIGVFGDSAQKTGVASDVWRFFLVSHRPESSDTEFTWDSFISDNNNLLLKNLGNFVSRVLKFVNSRNYDSIMPDWAEYHEDSFDAFKDDIAKLLTRYIQELDAVNLRSGLSTVLAISQQGNGFLQSNKLDGNLFNNEPSKCAAVIGIAVNLVHLLASLLAPYMPDTASSINKQLCADPLPIPDCWSADSIKPGHRIGAAEHLFRPIKPEKAQEWRKAFGADEAKKAKEEEAALKVKKKAALTAAKAAKAWFQ
ncbi:tRNA synthetases class I (M)-domain-containing protein [Nemania serpens]|nr:tRNA synthetases class I (M)-domain-containing protein [Nemania serpens]